MKVRNILNPHTFSLRFHNRNFNKCAWMSQKVKGFSTNTEEPSEHFVLSTKSVRLNWTNFSLSFTQLHDAVIYHCYITADIPHIIITKIITSQLSNSKSYATNYPHSPTFLYALCSKTDKCVHKMCTHHRCTAFTYQHITVRK
jgi:hypothetical protein